MLPVGVIGINHKTANLASREKIAKGAEVLEGERAIFFPHPTAVLSTCNRTEIYFESPDPAQAHSDILFLLRGKIPFSLEERMYSYFGLDCFFHLCKVTSGIDSAILFETEIQRQVKLAYAKSKKLSKSLHFIFQKALKVGKNLRTEFGDKHCRSSLYRTLWQLGDFEEKKILLLGYSQINRGILSFLRYKKVRDITLCTGANVSFGDVSVIDRKALFDWQSYDTIFCASGKKENVIAGRGRKGQIVFDLSVPRSIDFLEEASVYNMEDIASFCSQVALPSTDMEKLVWEKAKRLETIYMHRDRKLKLDMSRVAGEGDDISDIFHAGYEKYEPFKADAESRMGNRSEFAKL